ncbi:hypothetical protein [Siminovitchia sp. 179-K 8D1 HS]
MNGVKIEPYIYLHPEQADTITKNVNPCDVTVLRFTSLLFFGRVP